MTHPRLGPHVNSLVPFSPQSPANRGMICVRTTHDQAALKTRSRASSYWAGCSHILYIASELFVFEFCCQMVRWYTVAERDPGLILNMRIRKDAPCLVLRLTPFENLESWGKFDGDSFRSSFFSRYFILFYFIFFDRFFFRFYTCFSCAL